MNFEKYNKKFESGFVVGLLGYCASIVLTSVWLLSFDWFYIMFVSGAIVWVPISIIAGLISRFFSFRVSIIFVVICISAIVAYALLLIGSCSGMEI